MSVDLSTLPPDQQQDILDKPALGAPPGVESNLANPSNRNIIPEAVIPICLVLTTLAILLRCYARVFVVKKINVDDILSLLGFGTYIFYVYSVYHTTDTVGFFVHQWDVSLRRVSGVQHGLQIAATCYTITLALLKSAILLQWIRVFAPQGTRGAFFWTCHVLLWINLLFYLSTTVAGNLICVPFQRIWDKTVPGVCYNGRPLNMTIGVFNLASDISILLLVQRAIWSLNMSLKRKLGIALIFAIGVLACAAAAFRLGVTVNYMTDPDWLYHVAGLSMGCIAEMTCILLVYNMPGIPMAFIESTFLSKVLNSLGSSLRSATRRRNFNTSEGSATAAKTASSERKHKQMANYGISLVDSHRPDLEHFPSTEQLRGTIHRAVVSTGNSLDDTSRTTQFSAAP
ncbi:hypothetical protein GGS23DRAFT_585383 [Durotheca rogersii]|uniref:uncharacterized protein n=1 Tax=Durotheca rogersii TaxID=419775 RepID=UPI002220DD5D|nr:uncharacterized protein GGS23DRAFT_585383 [Durotheca rogersii]KAI5859432.1 hypothetical protein GGS23DRAFT_585383 [Durotheca rogersii]